MEQEDTQDVRYSHLKNSPKASSKAVRLVHRSARREGGTAL